MTIFTRTAKDQSDYSFRINIFLPFIGRKEFSSAFFDDTYTKYGVELNSEMSYTRAYNFWCFVFCIFGFGLQIQRQYGY